MQRNCSVPYPQIYRKFIGTSKDGKGKSYWIQDLTEDYIDEVVRYYTTGFFDDEPLSIALGCKDDKLCVKEMGDLWIETLKMKLSLICLTEDENGDVKIAGFNTLYLHRNGDKDIKLNSIPGQKTFDVVMHYEKTKNIFNELGCNEYLSGMGLYVLPEHRGHGICRQLLLARSNICKCFGIKFSVTLFTNQASYMAAEKVGFKDFVTLSYADLAKADDNLFLPGIEKYSEIGKLMYKPMQNDGSSVVGDNTA